MGYAEAKKIDYSKVPIIDMTALRDGSNPIKVAQELHSASKDLGFIYWLTANLQNSLSNFAPLIIILFLVLIYFYSMYLFSMLTAHIVALAGAIFAITININSEPIIIVACTRIRHLSEHFD